MEAFFIKVEGVEYKVHMTIDGERLTYEIMTSTETVIYYWNPENNILNHTGTGGGSNEYLLRQISVEIENHYWRDLRVIWALI